MSPDLLCLIEMGHPDSNLEVKNLSRLVLRVTRLRFGRILITLGWNFDPVGKVGGISSRLYAKSDAGAELKPTHVFTPGQEAMVLAFQEAIPIVASLEAMPDGTVRVWREQLNSWETVGPEPTLDKLFDMV